MERLGKLKVAPGAVQVRSQIWDWLITVPQDTDWSEYCRELAEVRDAQSNLWYRLPYFPKEMQAGDRIFITYRGEVKGYMLAIWVGKRAGFTCSTSGKQWPEGYYVARTGPFYPVQGLKHPGFRGIRKFLYNRDLPLSEKG